MATRRIKSTINSPYVQPLKVCTKNPLIVNPSNNYNNIVFTKKHKSCDLNKNEEVLLWAKFNSNTFDGIFLNCTLFKNNKTKQVSNVTFKISSVDIAGTWAESQLLQSNSLNGKLSVTANDLLPVDLDGEITLAIEASFNIRNKKYSKKIYVNHLGIYENVFRLRQDVEFLDITKEDE